MLKRLCRWLLKVLYGGIPNLPSEALWQLIDAENQKPENEIRCDYIEAWEEATRLVTDFKV